MSHYLIVLGTNTSLCFTELKSVLLRKIRHPLYTKIHPRIILLTLHQDDTASEILALMQELGGIIKIALVLTQLSSLNLEQTAQVIAQRINSAKPFGISIYSKTVENIQGISQSVKKVLKNTFNLSTRFILPTTNSEISTVLLAKQELQEFLLVKGDVDNRWYVAQTVVYQNVDDWTKRDFGKPFRDVKTGILPPKIARIMVNLGLPKRAEPLIYDPFCGSGTILAEALLLGCRVIGSDLSKQSAIYTSENLKWLMQQYTNIQKEYVQEVFVSDATHISEQIKGCVDAIITEPFMGALFSQKGKQMSLNNRPISREYLKNIIKGLNKLYLGVLKDWSKILNKGGKIVISLPEIHFNGYIYFVKKTVDSCEKLGYTLEIGPLSYYRPQAYVRRQIYILVKNNS